MGTSGRAAPSLVQAKGRGDVARPAGPASNPMHNACRVADDRWPARALRLRSLVRIRRNNGFRWQPQGASAGSARLSHSVPPARALCSTKKTPRPPSLPAATESADEKSIARLLCLCFRPPARPRARPAGRYLQLRACPPTACWWFLSSFFPFLPRCTVHAIYRYRQPVFFFKRS